MTAKICIVLFLILVCKGAQNKICSDMQSQCNKMCEKWGKYALERCNFIAGVELLGCNSSFARPCRLYDFRTCKEKDEFVKCKKAEEEMKELCAGTKRMLPEYQPPPPLEKECTIDCAKEYTECLNNRRNNRRNNLRNNRRNNRRNNQ